MSENKNKIFFCYKLNIKKNSNLNIYKKKEKKKNE